MKISPWFGCRISLFGFLRDKQCHLGTVHTAENEHFSNRRLNSKASERGEITTQSKGPVTYVGYAICNRYRTQVAAVVERISTNCRKYLRESNCRQASAISKRAMTNSCNAIHLPLVQHHCGNRQGFDAGIVISGTLVLASHLCSKGL